MDHIPKAAAHLFYHLDLAVKPAGYCIADMVLEVGQDMGKKSGQPTPPQSGIADQFA
jgi:hypothetical protein